ncbi:MAG: GGDEF domain-containing protein, partial [candidate division NC10 bacterium]|nr:GGDEF domain-containing protein [candidate division NC10 bacterium]
MKQFLETLGRLPRPYLIALSLTLFSVVASIDYLTGEEIAVSLFYSVPISLVAWFLGRGPGILLSVLSAVTWLAADLMLGFDLEDVAVHFWNATVGLGYFLVVTYVLTALKRAWDRETELARTDGLTGIANRQYFYELAHAEAYRSQRYGHPISLAYL